MRKMVVYLDNHPEVIQEPPARRSCTNTFNKIYSLLGAPEIEQKPDREAEEDDA